jgi:hypothetical protein
VTWALQEQIRARLLDEQGTLYSEAGRKIALCYPSPYSVGMSSLGFQTIYREICGRPGLVGRAGISARRRRGLEVVARPRS